MNNTFVSTIEKQNELYAIFGLSEDIHFNTAPVIEMVGTVIDQGKEWTVIYFKEKFVTNDWCETSTLMSEDPRYIEAQAVFVAHAMDRLEMMPGAEYNVDWRWSNEQTLWISGN